MSQKVGILDFHQAAGELPRTFVKRDIACLMVDRMAAEHISQRVIRMFPRDSIFPAFRLQPRDARYIPEKLPPREIPGCYFQPPQSDTWRIQHRTVTFASI